MHLLYTQFARTFTLNYSYGHVQPLKFAVYIYNVNDVRNISDLTRHDLIGEVELILAEIVAEQQVTRILSLKEEFEGTIPYLLHLYVCFPSTICLPSVCS